MSDRRRFEGWVRRHHADLYRHALWLTGDPALAEELVQETFYRAWQGYAKLRRRDRPLPWLLGILRRACFTELARQGQRGGDYPLAEGDAVVEGDEQQVDLARALARLTPAQRDLLLLYALQGLSYREIAEALDVPLGTVMSRLSRARAALRREWGEDEEGRVIPFPGGRGR